MYVYVVHCDCIEHGKSDSVVEECSFTSVVSMYSQGQGCTAVRHRSYKAGIGLSARPARQILSRSFVMSGKHVGNGERCLGAMLCGNALSTTLLKRTYVTCQVDGR